MAEEVTVRVVADTAPFQTALENLQQLSDKLRIAADRGAEECGRQRQGSRRHIARIGLNLAGLALEQGLKPLQALAGSMFSSLLGGLADCCRSPRAACLATSCRSPAAAWCRRRAIFRWAAMSA